MAEVNFKSERLLIGCAYSTVNAFAIQPSAVASRSHGWVPEKGRRHDSM